jgi:predicted nucleic acid-binding protein
MAALLRSSARLAVDDAALIEAVFVLERVLKLQRRTVAAAVAELMAQPAIDMDRTAWAEILEGYESHPKLSVVDVYLERRARHRGALPLYTFDARLAAELAGAQRPPRE